MLQGKCSRPRQKWAHHFISLKVLSTAERDIGKEEPFWKGPERKESFAATVSSSQERAMLCKGTWTADSCCSGKGLHLMFPQLGQTAQPCTSKLQLLSSAAILGLQIALKNKPPCSALQGQLTVVRGKHTNPCMEKQLQLHLKNLACIFLGRKYSEMCCCSSLILPMCNSLCLRNTSRYVTVEDIPFFYGTVALK